MENNDIPDSSLTASSVYTDDSDIMTYGANKGRLNMANTAWAAAATNTKQWIQVRKVS